MDFFIWMFIFFSPSIVETLQDPVDGWLAPSTRLEDLECTPMTTEAAQAAAPGEITPARSRQEFIERRAVICRERLMPKGLRRGQDDAVLSTLRGISHDAAALIAALTPAERDRTWLVEAFYPDARVTQKMRFAAQNALHERALAVSDRTPTLAAGDVRVLAAQDRDQAYAVACARYKSHGALGPNEALLAMVSRDSRSTVLHAGTCIDGRWRWLK